MISAGLLDILCCPETHQRLTEAAPDLIREVNKKIAEGQLLYRSGKKVEHSLQGGLLREDGKALYPIRNGLPELLVEKAIALPI